MKKLKIMLLGISICKYVKFFLRFIAFQIVSKATFLIVI